MKEHSPRTESLRHLAAALAFLSGGAALVVYVLFNFSLGAALVFTFALIAGTLAWRLRGMETTRRAAFLRLLLRGALVGLLATLAYDGARLAIVRLFRLPLNPFEAFPYFGYAIAGESIARRSALAFGTLYHFMNGIFFGVSYCLLLGGRRWFYGVLWAFGLEVLMFSIYPTWLNLDAVLKEFTFVSVSGHIAYGAVLGALATRVDRHIS
ncbi:MAG TPA: hypothetical protein VGV59_07115 [Pyrinomonadaceae bacterium]|nr:hypothetical protein [Pyrinomonadaceae bacterium]